MKNNNQPQGKVFTLLPKSEWTQKELDTVYLPQAVRCHMLLVLGWASQRDWVEIATVGIIPTAFRPS